MITQILRQRCVWIAATYAFASQVGCDSGLPMQRVSGLIKFDGGRCPSDGRITFKPMESPEGLPDKVGTAQFQKDGKFSVTTFEKDDGLLPGRYRVEIMCLKNLPNFADPLAYEKASFIAPGYEPEELFVKKGEAQTNLVYDVPLRGNVE